MSVQFGRFLRDESGATAIEYGLIAALVSVAAIGALTQVGVALRGGVFDKIVETLQMAGG